MHNNYNLKEIDIIFKHHAMIQNETLAFLVSVSDTMIQDKQ